MIVILQPVTPPFSNIMRVVIVVAILIVPSFSSAGRSKPLQASITPCLSILEDLGSGVVDLLKRNSDYIHKMIKIFTGDESSSNGYSHGDFQSFDECKNWWNEMRYCGKIKNS